MIVGKRSDGVSPVVATILMVAISVVLAAVLFVVIQQTMVRPSSVSLPMGIHLESNENDYWVVSIDSGEAYGFKSSVQIQAGGMAVEGYSYSLEDIRSNSTILPNTNITWMDNNNNEKIDPGDSLLINKKPNGLLLPQGDYLLVLFQENTKISQLQLVIV